MHRPWFLPALFLTIVFSPAAATTAAELLVGAAEADITPHLPVALDGQFRLRISRKTTTPVTADVIAVESRRDGRSLDAAVMVSCDLVTISEPLRDSVYQAVRKRMPGFDLNKLLLNATHSHTAPVIRPGRYDIPETGVMKVEAYLAFAADRISEAIEKAWKNRKPGSFTWGLGHAAVAENRRAVHSDGRTQKSRNTAQPSFRSLEAYSDHDIGSLFFWNKTGKLLAVAVNVSCPAQEVEAESSTNADFWHPVRESLKKTYGSDLCVVAWIGAAGDQSPHLMYHQNAQDRMRDLRKLSRLDEIARRIVGAVDETFQAIKYDRHGDVVLVHKVITLSLPMRLVTDAEYAETKAAMAAEKPVQRRRHWYQETLDRYERRKTDPNPVCKTEIHVLRIGDVAICTNRFEMFTDYGVQIKARSKANQTFIVQLAGPGTYLPTQRAVDGGGYSAIVQSNEVGPEGGQILVERTVELMNSLWAKPN